MSRPLASLFLAISFGCAVQRIDPHVPGDRCLYGCPDGMTCIGTVFVRRNARPGVCQLVRNRCMATADCRPRERCVRPGPDVGLCHPEGLL